MDEIIKGAMQQVPALCVVVFLVIQVMKILKSRDDDARASHEAWMKTVRECGEQFGRNASVLERVMNRLDHSQPTTQKHGG